MWYVKFFCIFFSRLAPNIISPLVSPLKALVPPSLLQKHGSPSSHSQSPNGQQFSGIPNTSYAPFPNQSVQQGSQGNSSLLFFATFLISSSTEIIYFGFSYLANTASISVGTAVFELDWCTYRWKFSDRFMLWDVIIMGNAVPTADLLLLFRSFSRSLLAMHLPWLVRAIQSQNTWAEAPWQCPAQPTHSDAQDMELDKENRCFFTYYLEVQLVLRYIVTCKCPLYNCRVHVGFKDRSGSSKQLSHSLI